MPALPRPAPSASVLTFLVFSLGTPASAPAALAQPAANPCRTAAGPAGQVEGTVADPQGGRVRGATVTVRCAAGPLVVVTDASGRFVVDLAPGSYPVLVALDGFDDVSRTVSVRAAATTRLDVTLQVASLAADVTVRAGRGTVVTSSRTATRTETPLLETPQSVTVITATQIAEQASPNVQEVLRYTAGVRNELYGIDNRGDWFSLRGSDSSTVLLNGMRLPITGWYGVVREEPYAFDQLAVLRGPSSIIAGQNDPGGVVNMVSKRPQAQAQREFSLRTGNYQHLEFRSDTTGPIDRNGSLLYRFVAVGKDTNTQVNFADEQRVFLAPSLTWRGRRASLTGYGEYQYDRSKNTNAFLGREGTLESAPNGPIPTDLFIGEPDWDRYGGTRWRGGYEARIDLGPGWQVRHSTRHDRVDGLMKSLYAAWWDGFKNADGESDPDGRYLGRYRYMSDDRARITATEGLLEGVARTGGIEHRLLFGVDGVLHDARQISTEDAAAPLDVYSPVYGIVDDPTLAGATPIESEIRRVGFFAQDQMKIARRLSVRTGLRRDRVGNAVIGGEKTTEWATTGNVGLVYELIPGLAPYVSYSQSFDPIAGTTAEGLAFEPKRGEQVEVGTKWESRTAPAQVTGAYYTITERNRLANDPDDFGRSIQIGEAHIKGLELEARGEVASWTTLGSYTWMQARATAASFGGNLDPTQQLEGIPEHQASLWAVHDFTRFGWAGLRLGGGLRYIGRIGDGTGDVFVPSVALVDLMGSYAIRNWRVSVNLNNVADKSYIATCLARGDCWFGQRRTLSITAGFTY